MSKTQKRSTNESVITPEGTFSFPAVFKAQRDDETGRETFGVTIGFTPEDQQTEEFKTIFPKLQQLAIDAAKLYLGTDDDQKAIDLLKNGTDGFRNPFRRDKLEKKGFPEGSIYFAARKSADAGKPGVVDANVQKILDPAEIYGGVRGRLSVTAYWYDKKGNKGVTFGLNNVQKIKDGPKLGGGAPRPEDEFEKAIAAGPPKVSDLI